MTDPPPVPPQDETPARREETLPERVEPAPFPFWSLADVLLFAGLALPVFVIAYAITFAPLYVLGIEAKALRLLIPQFAGYAAALLPLWLVFRSRHGRSPLEALRLGMEPGAALRSAPLGVSTAVLILGLGVALRTPRIDTPMEDLLQDPVSIAAVGVLASTIGPVFEEMFFRGLLQPVLVARLGVIPGIVIAALPFALLHGPQYAWSWRHLVLITVAGAVFGWRRYRSGSTGSAAVMHAAYNLTLFIGFLIGRMADAEIPQAV